jgi:hypothetical protein
VYEKIFVGAYEKSYFSSFKERFFFNINTIQIIYFLMFYTPSVKYLPPDLTKRKKLKSKKIPK